MPVDTFQEWMKKQPVKESLKSSEPATVSSTYDDWIGKQVAEKQSRPDEAETTQIQTVQSMTKEIAVKPASNLANPEQPREDRSS